MCSRDKLATIFDRAAMVSLASSMALLPVTSIALAIAGLSENPQSTFGTNMIQVFSGLMALNMALGIVGRACFGASQMLDMPSKNDLIERRPRLD